MEIYNIQLYSINMVLSECERTHKVCFAFLSLSEVS